MQSNVNYVLEEIIGEGAMAVVYKARHRELDSFHAIKKLKVQDFDVQKRLIQEGKLLARIRHPNILSVTDLVKLDGVPSLVMEYIQGPSLAEVLSKFDINERQIDALARGIMNGVMVAHKKGLIHRDLKPGNILIDIVDGVVVPKVADFGLAKILHSSEPILPQTRSGITMGTPAYMAPEQIKHFGSVDERADIFSLGIILYELITGKGCFTGGNTMEIWEHICNGKYVLPEEINTSIPIRMKRTIEKALLVDREDRFSTVQEMLDCWCTDEEEGYVPLLSKDERDFWPKELLERMIINQEDEEVDADETLDFSEQIDIAPLLNMVQDLEHIHSKKTTSPPLSIHGTIGDDLGIQAQNKQKVKPEGMFGFILVGVLALGMIFWNTDFSQETVESQDVVSMGSSQVWIANSLLNPFDSSSKSHVLFEQARDRLLKGEYYHACSLARTLIKDHEEHAAVFALTGMSEFLRGNNLESYFLLKKAEALAAKSDHQNKKLYQVDHAIVMSDIKDVQQDPLALLLIVLSKWSAHDSSLVDDLASFQQSNPTSIAFLHLELRHYREIGDWKQYDEKVQKLANVYTSSTALQIEYALRLQTNNPKEVEERLTHLQKTDASNVDLSLYLANFFAIQGNEHLRMQQFMLSMSDTVSQQEQMRLISEHAKVLASIGRIFEAEKLWNFCLDGFSSLDLVQFKAQCALDAFDSLHMIEPSKGSQHWMDSLSKSTSSQFLSAEWRLYYSVMLRAAKGRKAILSNDKVHMQKIEQEFAEMVDKPNPFVHVSSIIEDLEQQKVLLTYNQEAQNQYLQERYKQRVPICSEIVTVASIADQSNLPQRAKKWRESFLQDRCAFQFPNLFFNKAQIHVDLAKDCVQQDELEKAKEHLQVFFQLWGTADANVPLYKKAKNISKSLGM